MWLNKWPSDPFLSNLHSQLWYSTEQFQSLKLIVLVMLVPWINHLCPVCWFTFWKFSFGWNLVCKFDIAENTYFSVLIVFINATCVTNLLGSEISRRFDSKADGFKFNSDFKKFKPNLCDTGWEGSAKYLPLCEWRQVRYMYMYWIYDMCHHASKNFLQPASHFQ